MNLVIPKHQELRRNFLKHLLSMLLLAALVLAIGIWAHYKSNARLETHTRDQAEVQNVGLAWQTLSTSMQLVFGDLLFLSQLNELNNMLDRADRPWRRALSDELINFSRARDLYAQIRFIDATGQEIVRVNHNNGKPFSELDINLQSKVARYYFGQTMALKPGKIFVSPFDLNQEKSRLEHPLKPVIRVATPLVDEQGQKAGILILNILGEKLVRGFRDAAVNIADQIMLVNADGDWLSSKNREDEWGFILGHERSFATRFPEVWQNIKDRDQGQLHHQQGLFTFATLFPDKPTAKNRQSTPHIPDSIGQKAYGQRNWKIIAHITPQVLHIGPQGFLRNNALLYTVISLLLVLLALVVAWGQARHQIILAQRDYERLFRDTMENVDLAVVTLVPDGKIIYCNDFFLNQTAYKKHEVLGKDWFDTYISSEDRSQERKYFAGILTKPETPGRHNNQLMTQLGKRRRFHWNYSVSLEHDGQVHSVTAIGEDTTEHHHTKVELNKLINAVEQSPNTVLITDTQGLIEYVNPNFTNLTGYTKEEVIGKSPSILKTGETPPEVYKELWSTISNGGEWRGEFHNRKKNGELYWEFTIISPIVDSKGNITNFLAVKEDVTERKRLQQEVEDRNKELIRTQSLTVIGRMASMIAHDLRNPLSSVKMSLQILGKQNQKKEESEELKDIALAQVHYMEEILEDMLQYSRPDALKPEWLDINKLLDMAVALTGKAINERNAKITTNYAAQLPTLHGDPNKLRQVFSNLIMNALQAMDNTGILPEVDIQTSLELYDNEPRVRVEICDNGPGINGTEADKLFEPFFTTRTKGTGLGLAIVKRLLEQHHGAVQLLPGEKGGIRAVVILPTSQLKV